MQVLRSIQPKAPVRYRGKEPRDREFLLLLYAGTRQMEMDLLPWTQEQKLLFLQQQFEAQSFHYDQHYPGAAFAIISDSQGRDIGRLYLHRGETEFRIIDIALLPQHQRQGIGSAILQDILAEAAAQSPPVAVSLHVACGSPAVRLYARLGFSRADSTGIYDLMEWKPGNAEIGSRTPL